MIFKNVEPVVVTFAVLFLQHIIASELSFELPSDPLEVLERSKRSMTTICVVIKPSRPQEEPYLICKDRDSPPFPKGINSNTRLEEAVPIRGEQLESHPPSYSDVFSRNSPAPAYNTQFTENKGIAAYSMPQEQVTHSLSLETQTPFSGLGGFRSGEEFPTSQQQQQFFPPAPTFQHGNEQQQQANDRRQDKSPTSIPQFAFGTRLPTAGPQSTYSQGTSFGPTTESKAAYEPQHTDFRSGLGPGARPVSAFRYGRTQSGANTRGNVFGGRTSTQLPIESTNKGRTTAPGPNDGSYAQPTFAAKSLPIVHLSQAYHGQTVPTPSTNAESTATAKHVNAQFAPVAPQSSQSIPASSLVSPENGGFNTQSSSDRHHSTIDEDVFRTPNWGFSPDELMNTRSMPNTQNEPRLDFPVHRQLQNVPVDYMDDPVMRQFYASLEQDPTISSVETEPFLASPNTAKNCPPTIERQRQLPHYVERTTLSQPNFSRRPSFRNSDTEYILDSATCCSHMPYTPPQAQIRNLPPCDPNYQRSYSFQPVFIALPCYGQQPAFGNLGLSTPQLSYPRIGDAHIFLGNPTAVPNLAMLNPPVGSVNPTPQFYQMPPIGFNTNGMDQKVEAPQPHTISNMPEQPISDGDPILGSARKSSSKQRKQPISDGDPILGSARTSSSKQKETTAKPTVEEDFDEDTEDVKPENEKNSAESKKDTENANSIQETDTTEMDSGEIFDSTMAATEVPKTPTIGKPAANSSREQKNPPVAQNIKPITNKSETARKAYRKDDIPQMEEETQKSFDSLMSLAKIAKNINKEEFAGTGQQQSQTGNGSPARKGKRQNVRAGRSGGATVKRQYVQRL